MTWEQLILPLGAGIVAFFVTQSRSHAGWDFPLLLVGWALFSLVMAIWRLVTHLIDEQIVALYPDMLRLEQKDGTRETQTRYYFNNLSGRAKDCLGKQLSDPCRVSKYENLKEKARNKGKNHYDLLLEVWTKYGRYSVTGRGHLILDSAVLALIAGFLVAVLWIEFSALALLGLLFLAGFLPLGE